MQALSAKDIKRIEKSKYKNSDRAKYLRRAACRKRKGFDDRHQQQEGVMYSSGALTTCLGQVKPFIVPPKTYCCVLHVVQV